MNALTRGRQLAAIAALVASPSVEAAASSSGISKTTLYRWIEDDPAFRERLEAARLAAFEDGLRTIKGAATKAAGKLIELLNSRNEALRFRAALAVIELGLRVHAEGDIERRISALEDAFSLANPSGAH